MLPHVATARVTMQLTPIQLTRKFGLVAAGLAAHCMRTQALGSFWGAVPGVLRTAMKQAYGSHGSAPQGLAA